MSMKKIGNANYVNTSKVLGARIYQKDGKIKVAIQIDAKAAENQVLFSDECATAQEAEALVLSLGSDE